MVHGVAFPSTEEIKHRLSKRVSPDHRLIIKSSLWIAPVESNKKKPIYIQNWDYEYVIKIQ